MQLRSPLHARHFTHAPRPFAGLRIPRRQSRTLAQFDLPERELVSLLPGIADGACARVWRFIFKPGQAEHLRLGGRSSIMVESGRMTIQYRHGCDAEIVATGPNLPFVDEQGMPVEPWLADTFRPPYLIRSQGIIRDDGDFGIVANDGNEDLVAIVVERTQS